LKPCKFGGVKVTLIKTHRGGRQRTRGGAVKKEESQKGTGTGGSLKERPRTGTGDTAGTHRAGNNPPLRLDPFLREEIPIRCRKSRQVATSWGGVR